MKIVIAPDSFKGSLSAKEICNEVNKAAKKVFPNCETKQIPIADGGEGTLDSIIEIMGGDFKHVEVSNPLGKPVIAKYGILDEETAIVEMAQASGLPLIPDTERDIMKANTYGTGQLILDAMENGYKRIYIGLGGSATNDGGIGCAAALGIRFFDSKNEELEPIPENLERIDVIDFTNRNLNIDKTEFIIMSDVKNPLTGESGATNVFSKQKGAKPEEQKVLEKAMCHYENKLEITLGKKIGAVPGAGAAGGLGAGLLAFCNAKVVSGIEKILEIVQFEKEIEQADLVITGEGRMDNQSAYGKVVSGIGTCCKRSNIPCVAIVGSIGDGADELYNYGISSIMTTINGVMTLDEAMKDAHKLCYEAAERLFRLVNVGMKISE